MKKIKLLNQWLTSTDSDSTYVAFDQKNQYTSVDLALLVSKLVQQLQTMPAQRWVISVNNSFHFVACLLALLSDGKTPVLIASHRVQSMLDDESDDFCDAILTDTPYTTSKPQLFIDEVIKNKAASTTLKAIEDDAQLILFTSGSTGKPKQVVKTVAVLNEEIRWIHSLWGNQLTNGILLSTVSHQHLYGLTFRIMLPMSLGIPFYADIVSYSEQLSYLSNECPQYILISSPAFLKRMDDKLSYGNCQFILASGGKLNWETAALVEAMTGQFPHEIYGSTETGVMASRHRTEAELPWCLFDNVQIQKDRDNHEWVVSPIITEKKCSLNDEIEFLNNSSQFYLKGRRDRIVKIEEKRVSLDEVEMALMACGHIEQVATLVIAKGGRTYLGAVIVLVKTDDAIVSPKEAHLFIQSWQQALQKSIEPVAIPRFWRIVDAIPCNSEGKISTQQLQELFDVTSN